MFFLFINDFFLLTFKFKYIKFKYQRNCVIQNFMFLLLHNTRSEGSKIGDYAGNLFDWYVYGYCEYEG